MKNKNKIYQILIIIVLFVGINFCSISVALAEVSPSSIISLANSSRAQAGLGSLSTNSQLESAAFAKANDMLEKDYFTHTSPDGKTPWDFIKEAGYSYVYAGENLAIGYTDSTELHNAWMNSPSHRDNIMNPNFREIGVAVVSGEYQGGQTTVVVQTFGSTAYSEPESSESSGIKAEASNEGVTSSEGAEPTNSNQTPTKEFSILLEKSGFSPGKIYTGDEVTFKVTITGEAAEIYFTVGDQKINLKDLTQIQQNSDEKIYEKKEVITKEGDQPVILTVADKWGNREAKDLGKLSVAKKVIAKETNSHPTMAAVKDFTIRNISLIALSLALLTLGFAFYLTVHLQKYGLRHFLRHSKIA